MNSSNVSLSETDRLSAPIVSSRGAPISFVFMKGDAQRIADEIHSWTCVENDPISRKDRDRIHAKIAMLIDPDFIDVATAQIGKQHLSQLQSLADF